MAENMHQHAEGEGGGALIQAHIVAGAQAMHELGKQGVVKFREWTALMTEQIGEHAMPFWIPLWDASHEYCDTHLDEKAYLSPTTPALHAHAPQAGAQGRESRRTDREYANQGSYVIHRPWFSLLLAAVCGLVMGFTVLVGIRSRPPAVAPSAVTPQVRQIPMQQATPAIVFPTSNQPHDEMPPDETPPVATPVKPQGAKPTQDVQLARLQSTIAAQKVQIAELQSNISAIRDAFDTARSSYDNLHSSIATAKSSYDDLHGSIEKFHDDSTDWQEVLPDVEKHSSSVDDGIADVATKSSSLDDDLSALDDAISDAE